MASRRARLMLMMLAVVIAAGSTAAVILVRSDRSAVHLQTLVNTNGLYALRVSRASPGLGHKVTVTVRWLDRPANAGSPETTQVSPDAQRLLSARPPRASEVYPSDDGVPLCTFESIAGGEFHDVTIAIGYELLEGTPVIRIWESANGGNYRAGTATRVVSGTSQAAGFILQWPPDGAINMPGNQVQLGKIVLFDYKEHLIYSIAVDLVCEE